ncbi:MAG TPA: NAD-dependent epimerase/dehydratase family protein, partial [Roseiarcus sp.]
MRVFVTGATGWIGSAVVKDLLALGHKVTGLTTTTRGAQKLHALGAEARVGRLHDHALLREGAVQSDGVIHLAFIHGLANMNLPTRFRLFAGVLNGGIVQSFLRILAETESGAIRALGAGLESSKRPLVVASGVLS